jgi:N-hydroxyarylamine O-acetyltransferase
MNVAEYLLRLGIGASPAADSNALRSLQRAHLLAVPFENLDIHWNQPIVLDIDKFYRKIVNDRRGGFCYELNGLFNELLRSLGYQTRLVSARVFNGKTHGPEFDHAAIIVTIGEDDHLVDVGFGAFTAEPLRFILDDTQSDANGIFVIRRRADEYFEVMKNEAGTWRSEYIFRDIAHDLSDFRDMCDFQQYSPDSHFTKGKLCSIMTAGGRKTLTDTSFIVTVDNEKRETPVESDATFYGLLLSEFGIAAERI